MGRSSRTSKLNLEKLIGLALWLTQLWPYMRIWIRHWYHDLYSIPATHYSIDNGDWRQFSSHLDDHLHIIFSPSWDRATNWRSVTGGSPSYSQDEI